MKLYAIVDNKTNDILYTAQTRKDARGIKRDLGSGKEYSIVQFAPVKKVR